MSYSDTCNLIETEGYSAAFREIYENYKNSKELFEQRKREMDAAESELNSWMSSASHYVKRAANDNYALKEENGYVVRMVVDGEVVHFRKPHSGDLMFIGNYTLSQIEEQL